MNSAERSQVHQTLLSRCHAMADSWYKAVAQTGYAPIEIAQAREQFVASTEQVIALLFTESFERGQAQAIGASLAGLHYIEPEALSRTQEVLAQQLTEGLSADQVVALQPRLAELLGALIAGFSQQAREKILSDQEQTRGALTAALRQAKEELQSAYEEVEQRVQERTTELSVANERLRREITERKQVQEALRDSEERFRGIFQNAAIGLYRTSPDGRVLIANPALLRMLGYSSLDELAQRNLEEGGYEPGYARSAFKQRIESAGLVIGLESAWIRKDGTTLFVRESARVVCDETGNTLYYEGAVEDITERKQVEDEIKQRNRELSALNAIAATVNQSLALSEVLNEALDRVLDTLGLEVGLIRLLDERSNTLDLKIHRGVDLSREVVERLSRIRLAGSPLAEVMLSGEPLIVKDISAHPIVELIGRRDLKSLVVVPLGSKEQVLGTMNVYSPTSDQFTSQDVRLLTSVGYQIGMAIENAMLYQQTQNSASQLVSLFEIGQSLTSSFLDLDRTLRLIVRHAVELLGVDLCRIFLYDPATDELLGQVIHGVSDEDSSRARVPLSQIGAAIEAQATLQPVAVEDTSQNHRLPDGIVEKWGIKSSLTVPLVAGGRFMGVIFLSETEAPRRFTANEIELARSFASQAALAIQNAQLYARSEELAISEERVRIAHEIHDDLAQRLASVLMRVDLCLDMIDGEPEEAKQELDRMGVTLQDGIQAVRRSILALRPLALEQLGFHQALSNHIDGFAQQNGISVYASLLDEGSRLPARIEYTLFRIVQEALNNVRLHAQADNVWIDLDWCSPDTICLGIRDDGHGFDSTEVASDMPRDDDRGLGLLHMRERVEAMDGSFRLETEPTVGTKIAVTLPLES